MSTYVTFWESAANGHVPVMSHVILFHSWLRRQPLQSGSAGEPSPPPADRVWGLRVGWRGRCLVSTVTLGWRKAEMASIMETHFTLYVCTEDGVRWEKLQAKSKLLHALETSTNQKLQVFGGHVHPLANHCWPKNMPALCSSLTPQSQRFIPMHPDANPNRACRHGRGREGVFNGSLVSFSPRSHHFLRDTEVQKPNAQLSPGVNASGCCVSRH